MSVQKNVAERVRLQCKLLRLPTLATVLDETIRRAEADNLPLADFIADLLAQEIEARRERRIERLRKQSKLPPGKTFAVFDESRLPVRIQRQLPQLQAGDFVNRAENVLCFGLPGMGNRLGRQSFWLGLGDAVERIGGRASVGGFDIAFDIAPATREGEAFADLIFYIQAIRTRILER